MLKGCHDASSTGTVSGIKAASFGQVQYQVELAALIVYRLQVPDQACKYRSLE